MKTQPIKALLFMKKESERVPNKNLRDFNGRPLFHWILNILSNSKYIEEIIINTDSDTIANDSSKLFNTTIHKRPKHLLVLESNEPYQLLSYDLGLTEGKYFLNTHSTNPLLKTETIDKAIETFFDNIDTYDSLFSVTELKKRFFNKDYKPINHDLNNFVKTQNLPFIYEENSCFYIFTRKSFMDNNNRLGKNPYLYTLNKFEAVDIDEETDFQYAEFLMNKRLLTSEEDTGT